MRGLRATTFIVAALTSAALAAPANAANLFTTQIDIADSTVGTSGNAGSILIDSDTTAPHNANASTIAEILVVPSCKEPTIVGSCVDSPDADPGVFSFGNGTGAAGTACAGNTFTFGPTGVMVGMVPVLGFNRVGGDLTLLSNETCLINFTFSTLKMPTADGQAGEPGIQTNSLLAVQAETLPTIGAENFDNLDFPTVTPASTPPPTTPTPVQTTPLTPVPTAPKCKKGQKLKKGRCVKKKRKRK